MGDPQKPPMWLRVKKTERPSEEKTEKMNSESQEPYPPKHLSPEMRRFWNAILGEFEADEASLKLLQAACEAWDEAQRAREAVVADGLTVRDRFGQLRPHPLLAEERRQRESFLRAIDALGLDEVPDAP